MWSKVMMGLLLLVSSQAVFSQTWLNKTDEDIQRYTIENKERIQTCKQNGTLFTLTCQEEDELGRLFEVSYRFNLKDDRCVSYERQVPVHRHFVTLFLEQVSQQEAEATGNEIAADGEILNTVYIFENFQVHISVKEDRLSFFYTRVDFSTK